MSLFSIIGLYEELLLEGSYRGIGFAYVSSEDEPGRRILAFLFPGQDVTDFQDVGQWDGDIVVNGILSGDDYAHQADRLRTAFQTPGPATLVHPWLGTLQVELAPNRQPRIRFDHETLRICTFTLVVRRYTPRQPPAVDTLQALLDGLSDLRTQAYALLASVLAPVALTLSSVTQVEALAGEIFTTFSTLVQSVVNPDVLGVLAGPLAALGTIGDLTPDDTYAGNVGAMLAAPSAAVAATSMPLIPAAVAPGGSVTTPTPVDAVTTTNLLLSAITATGATTLTSAPIVIPPGPSLILCAQTLILADAITTASDIAFDSAQGAVTWRDTIAAALDAAASAAAAQAPSYPAAAAILWQSLTRCRAAWMADMNALIGRLPSVATFTPPATVPIWLVAQYLSGDDPSTVVATYMDLVRRNDIFHPGIPPAGPLEILVA
jgi:prophage DNA circulation protein